MKYVGPYFPERGEIHPKTAFAAQVFVELNGCDPSLFIASQEFDVSEYHLELRGGSV